MHVQSAFQPDDHYDRLRASDGLSRYGVYLSLNTERFQGWEERSSARSTEFAAAAWEIAQSPVMAPGYVVADPRVLATRTRHDDDHRLAVEVDLVGTIPPAVHRALGYRWRGWRPDHLGGWRTPGDYAIPTVLPLLTVQVPIDANGLPTPTYRDGEVADTAAAKAAVLELCIQVNAALAPILTALVDGGVG
jgi:hypothetical protein